MQNKVAIVSGGTKGIGRAIVMKFLEEDFQVFTCARNLGDLENLQNDASEMKTGKLFTIDADLSKKDQVVKFANFVNSNAAHIDVLINNTGVFVPGEISSEEDGKLELMMNTNLYSAYHLTRSFINKMIERKSGDIFNICSIASKKAYPNGGSYSISKFAMYGMSQGLREEMKPHGIRVTSVLPGATFTASWEGVDLPEERFIKAQDVANAIWSTYSLSKNTVVEDIVIRPQLGDI